jgi:hypothetical protein
MTQTAPGTTGELDAIKLLREYARQAGGGEEGPEALRDRISQLLDGERPTNDRRTATADSMRNLQGFIPLTPNSLEETSLGPGEIEGLIIKTVLSASESTGRAIAEQICLPFGLVNVVLKQLKDNRLLLHKESASLGDFTYQLTERGRELGKQLMQHCSYIGSAPVTIPEYSVSVKAQSLTSQAPTMQDLQEAFGDLRVSTRLMHLLGPALHSGRGIFLYGAPGNGKTSIAERIVRAYGRGIWIPRTLGVNGCLIRLFDPAMHEELPIRKSDGLYNDVQYDRRWVRIRRPTIVVGGELTMKSLDVHENQAIGISEAPLQLKSNGGAFVIDDLGRQRISIEELLNRLIIPLEKRYDYLTLSNGTKVQVPFDQLNVFSTNLAPKDLVDEAFLRRIPYKLDVLDPSEEDFLILLQQNAEKLGLEHDHESLSYLIDVKYKALGRPFRCCHPRDLLMQVRNHCSFHGLPLRLSRQNLDFAIDSYFAVME